MNVSTHRYILQAPDAAGFKSLGLVTRVGAHIRRELPIINGVAVEVDRAHEDELRKMAARGDFRMIEDRKVTVLPGEIAGPDADLLGNLDRWRAMTHTVGADKMWDQGVTGKGVTVAVIDTGVAPHKDLRGRIKAFHDVINGRIEAYDDHGHGTHVSGIVAGDGAASHGFLKGVAPEADIVGVKVLGGDGSGEISGVVEGIQWAVENRQRYDIKVLNMSLGADVESSWKDDPVCQAVEAAAAAGIVPVIAAGNSGPAGATVGTPGNAPDAISVAAVDDRGTPWNWDDRIALFSSRGPTPIDHLDKPDVAAPGVAIMSLKANSNGYVPMSGTSMASPVVAGAAALLVAAHPGATPAEIREALMDTAHHLWGYGAHTQGKGCIDVAAASQELTTA
jgi:serine protease AprX